MLFLHFASLWMALCALLPDAVVRQVNYWPEADAIVCTDGHNRFTRALYGLCDAARLETSDTPEFGLYMPYMGGNLLFTVDYTHIRTEYDGVSRDYIITLPEALSKPGKTATVLISANALQYPSSGGIWSIEGHDVRPGVTVSFRYGAASNQSFSRNGDLGVDRPDCFDFSADKCIGNEYRMMSGGFILEYGKGSKKGTRRLFCSVTPDVSLRCDTLTAGNGERVSYVTGSIPLGGDKQVIAIGDASGIITDASDFVCLPSPHEMLFRSDSIACALLSDYEVQTPDCLINPLSYVLPAAANAIWDEESGVWQHGAIGWRMPLPGWRAAYVGDVLGFTERQRRHFRNYAASQLTDAEVDRKIPVLDPKRNFARATEKVGNPMFTTGYIGRYPNDKTRVNHYDMNLVYIDALLWHLCWTGDIGEAREFWPTIVSHLGWEKRTFDPDGDGLYDAYCCIWASDGLYYDGGAVTHSSAYNLRANRMAARIGMLLGEERLARHFEAEAKKIARAIDKELWNEEEGVWAECRDARGLKRQHLNPALWTVYHAIDSDLGTPMQRYRATQYVDRCIPHIPFVSALDTLSDNSYDGHYLPMSCLSTTSWQPYDWSINNVALAEQMHTALAFWEAGRSDDAYSIFRSALADAMYLGSSPGNIAQISFFDRARGECYRDFGDPVGITSRAFIQGLVGVYPDFLNGILTLRPGFPSAWDGQPVTFSTPDFTLSRTCRNDTVEWFFMGQGDFSQRYDSIVIYVPSGSTFAGELADDCGICWIKSDSVHDDLIEAVSKTAMADGRHIFSGAKSLMPDAVSYSNPDSLDFASMTRVSSVRKKHNLKVADLFRQNYRYRDKDYGRVTLSLPSHGMGEWCHPTDTFQIAPGLGLRAAFTSLFRNFPDRLSFRLPRCKASRLYLKMCGTTNPMQSRIVNGIVRVTYTDGTASELQLINPVNWWPIEQELAQGTPAFYLQHCGADDVQPPYRMSLRTGEFYRPLTDSLNRPTDGGAATLLELKLDPSKTVRSMQLECLSNDVIIGIIDAYLK